LGGWRRPKLAAVPPTSYQKKPYLSDQEHMHTSND